MSYGTTLEAEFFSGLAVNKLLHGSIDDLRALHLLLELRTWSADAKSDGHIPEFILSRASGQENPRALIDILVTEGLAERVEDGWQIDWSDQKTGAARTKKEAEWKQKRAHGSGDHSLCPSTWTCRRTGTGSVPGTDTGSNGVSASKRPSKPRSKKDTSARTGADTDTRTDSHTEGEHQVSEQVRAPGIGKVRKESPTETTSITENLPATPGSLRSETDLRPEGSDGSAPGSPEESAPDKSRVFKRI